MITPRNTTPVAAVALALLGLLAGCNGGTGGSSGGGGNTGGGGTVVSGEYNDAVGPVTYDEGGTEIVRIASVDRSTLETDGTVRYVLENVSGQNLEGLTYMVQFYLPATGAVGEGSISLGFDTELTLPQSLSLYTSEPRMQIEAKCSKWTGGKMLGTKIYVEEERPRPTIPRADASERGSGTQFMNGLLECVSMDGLFDSPMRLELTLENTSTQHIGGLLVQAVFLDLDAETPIGETEWESLPSAAPGQRIVKEFDVSKAARTGRNVWIRIKQGEVL